MIEHLKDLIRSALTNDREGSSSLFAAKEMYRQLCGLNPLDFEQAQRAEFSLARAQFDRIANPLPHMSITGEMIKAAFLRLEPVLDYYRGQGSHLDSKPFTFIRARALTDIIKRDYCDLWLRVYPSHAWKSAVVLSGSILEAILYDVLSGPKTEPAANAYIARQPKHKSKGVVTSGNWTLEALIDAAAGIGCLRAEDTRIIHQTLREYRNFIHPMKEIRLGQAAGENEAALAVHALNAIIDHLEGNFRP
jgi:hypothetical protein